MPEVLAGALKTLLFPLWHFNGKVPHFLVEALSKGKVVVGVLANTVGKEGDLHLH